MKSARGLWISALFVVILTVASLVGLVSGALKPLLGLDLQGGVAVILSAPEGTTPDVMEQALENIRRRVDAFGVGEPEIFLSGNTIEVQIPGLSDSRIEQRSIDAQCLVGSDNANYGCAPEADVAQRALAGLEVASTPSEVCLYAADGTKLDCFASQQGSSAQAQADAAKQAIQVLPQASTTPSASASASSTQSASPSRSSSPVGPSPAAAAYCLTDSNGNQLACYPTQDEANKQQQGITSKVTKNTWCIAPTPPPPSPSPSPTPSPSKGPSNAKAKATATPSASGSPSASPSPPSGVDNFNALDRTGANDLPCDFTKKTDAQAALAAIKVTHVTTQYCVVSSQNQDLGCYTTQSAAAERQRETGQQRLLQVIGKTARLEERPTKQIVAPGDPNYQALTLTCGTPEEQAGKQCQGSALDNQTVVYPDANGDKVVLGSVVLTGSDITRASAQLQGGTQTNPTVEWAIQFDLDSEGARKFADATTTAVSAQPPANQIAIIVDHQIVSNPVVQSPITNGTGVITGNFTEQSAKDLATVLSAGALPVDLTLQSVRTVSPTLGEESLRGSVIAALTGLVLLFLYLLLYYRLLGIVAWFGMGIWAVLALALVSIAGKEFGYALSLAGVAGLVISLGVTADSYIVFFERLKDELRSGKSARTVVQPAFKRAFRTIVAADIVTGIAAAVLYITAVSSVRGFALTLGVATALDLFVVYFFKRPVVFLLARNRRLVELRGFGLTSAAAADHQALDHTGGVEA